MAVRGGKSGEVARLVVEPAIPRTGKGRFEGILIARASEAAVLDDLVVVDQVDGNSGEPERLRLGQPTEPIRAVPRDSAWLRAAR